MGRKHTEAQLLGLLDKRYKEPQWALFGQVPDKVSARSTRTADAIAVAMWESRGLEIHGFEIKVSRGDWLRELKKPDKSAPIQQFCDRWWVVTGADVVDVAAGEVPSTWGLLVPRGRKLVTVVEAPRLEPQQLTRHFVAAILRRAHRDLHDPEMEERVRAKIEEEVTSRAKVDHDVEVSQLRRRVRDLESELGALREAEEIAGCRISQWQIRDYGRVAHMLRNGGVARLEQQLVRLTESFGGVVTEAQGALDDLRKLKQEQD